MRAIRWAAFAVLVLAAAAVAPVLELSVGSRSYEALFPPKVIRITFDPGGYISEYVERYSALRARGGRVIIDGPCISACTMVVGLLPRDRICVTDFAQLAFHSASNGLTGAHSSEGTRLLWAIYPDDVRALLRKKKQWDGDDKKKNEHPDLIYVAGDELRTLIRPCGAGEG